ncbi:MAG: hypothetical protein ACXAAO_07575 [Candidatus Thorarchaeota archaeon]
MFGKSIIRYALAGVIALFLGSQLISSVSWVVFAWRFGNVTPLLSVWGGTLVVLIFSRRQTSEPVSTVMDVVSWGCTIYTAVVMLFTMIPYGLVASFFALAITVIICSSIKEPNGISSRISSLLEPAGSLGQSIPLIGKTAMTSPAAWSSIDKLKMKAIVLPSNLRGTVLDLLRERPLLPVSISRYEDCDILIVKTKGDEKILRQVREALLEKGVSDYHLLSSFMTNAVLGLPILEQAKGLALSGYMVATEEGTVQRLLDIWPNRIIVFPTRTGLRVVLRNDSAPGFDLEELPHGKEVRILLGRDMTLIPTGGVEIARESTAR